MMNKEGLTQSRLAEMLEIQPASISHILAGRNKPGFDLLQKILRRFPRINPDWLLLDAPEIYREWTSENLEQQQRTDVTEQRSEKDKAANSANGASRFPLFPEPTETTQTATRPDAPVKEVVRIALFYADGTFDSFCPTHK